MAFFQEATNWVLISFVIFAIGFWKFGLKLMQGKLDGRIEEIRKEIETAESLRIEAQELLAQYQRKQRDAAKEAEGIVASAQKHAAEIQKAAEAELNELIARKEEDRQEDLEPGAWTQLAVELDGAVFGDVCCRLEPTGGVAELGFSIATAFHGAEGSRPRRPRPWSRTWWHGSASTGSSGRSTRATSPPPGCWARWG